MTNADSAGRWRELLAGAGVRRAAISGSGVFRDEASDARLRQVFFDGAIETSRSWCRPSAPSRAPFQITSLEYRGDHAGEVTFDMALESAGALAFTACLMANRRRGEVPLALGRRALHPLPHPRRAGRAGGRARGRATSPASPSASPTGGSRAATSSRCSARPCAAAATPSTTRPSRPCRSAAASTPIATALGAVLAAAFGGGAAGPRPLSPTGGTGAGAALRLPVGRRAGARPRPPALAPARLLARDAARTAGRRRASSRRAGAAPRSTAAGRCGDLIRPA